VCVGDKIDTLTNAVRAVWKEEIDTHRSRNIYDSGDACSLSQISFVFTAIGKQIINEVAAKALKDPRVMPLVHNERTSNFVRRQVSISLSKC
jgi:hypothetical protein